MEFHIPAQSIKPFTKALTCISRFNEDVFFEVKDQKLELIGVNSSRSGYCLFTFETWFFEKYYLSNAAKTGREPALRFKLNCKKLIAALKIKSHLQYTSGGTGTSGWGSGNNNENKDGISKIVEKCIVKIKQKVKNQRRVQRRGEEHENEDTRMVEEEEESGEDEDEDEEEMDNKLIIQIQHKAGIVKTYRMLYEITETLHAIYDRDNCQNRIIVDAKLLKDIIGHFPRRMTDEVSLLFTEKHVLMRSWSESYSGGNNGIGGGGGGGNGPRVITAGDATRTMQTELLMDPEEFDIYHLTFYGNENNNISSTNSRYQQQNISTPVRPYPQKSQPQPPATNNTTATASTSGGNVNCIELTFGIKEFKAILSYSEAAELPLQAHFDAGGDPILFYVSSDIFDQSNFNVSRRKPSANSVVAPNDNSHFRSNNNNMNFNGNGNGNVIINSSADLSFDGISAEFVLATVSDQFSSTASQATTASHSISLSASLMSTSNNNNDIKSNSQLFQSPSSKSKSNLNPKPKPNSKPSRYDNLPPSSFSLINNNRTNDPIANSDKNPQPSSQNPIQSPAKRALGSDHSKQSKSDLQTPLFQENHQYQQHHHPETTMDADHNDFSQQPSNNPPSSGVILTGTESMTSSAVLSLQQKDNIPHVNPGGLPSQPAYDHKNRELEYQDSLMRTPRPPNSAVDSGLAPINISNSSLLKNVQKLNVNSVSSSAKNKPKNSWKWPGLEDPIGENDQPFNSQSVPNPPDNNNVNEPYFSTSSRIQQPDLRVVDINSESNSDSDSDLESGSNSVANTISGIRPPHRSKDNNNNDNKSRDSDSDSDSDSVVLSATPPSSKRSRSLF